MDSSSVARKLFGSGFTESRHFRALFGVPPYVADYVFRVLQHNLPHVGFEVKHVLWMFYFLKNYPTEDAMAQVFRKSVRTIRTWVWKTLTCSFNLLQTVLSSLLL